MIYITLFFFLALFASLDLVKGVYILKGSIFIFFVIVFIFLAGIRWHTGPDWNAYFDFYRDIKLYTKGGPLTSANLMEPGYTKINLWLHQLGFNYSEFLFVIAIVTIGLKAKVIFDHKAIMMTTLFLYYCYYLADIAFVRQFTAVSITLFSSFFIVKRKPVIFCFLVFIASTIHITSILFLFAYWIYHWQYSKKLLYFILVVSLLFGIINIADYGVEFIIRLLGNSSRTAAKLLEYKGQGMGSTRNPYFGFVIGMAKRLIVLPLFIWGVKIVDVKYRDKYIGYLNLLVFGNAIYFLFALSIPVIQRLSVPFLIFEIFIWSYLIVSFRDLRLRFLFYVLIVLFGAVRLYLFMAPYMYLYYPFKTIF